MNVKVKRFLAYFIDMVLVSTVVLFLSSISFLNTTKEEAKTSNKEYKEYIETIMEEENFKIENNINEISEKYAKVEKYLLPNSIINIFCIIAYFIVFNINNKGQTLGKKILKIRITSNNDSKLKWTNYFIRSLILNELFYVILSLLVLYLTSNVFYFYFITFFSYINMAILMIDLLMMLFRKDSRSLHDIISNTKVIEE